MIWRQMLGYVPVNLANIVVSFGTIAVLTRLFDGAEFGRYALAVVAMHFTHMVAFSWIEAAMARYYARAEANGTMASHIKTCYTVAGALSIIGLSLVWTAYTLLPASMTMKTVIMFALTSTCITLIYNLGIEAHRAGHRITRYSALHASQSLIGFSVGILLILVTPLRETAPFIGILVANFVALSIDLPFMLRKAKGGTVENDRSKKYLSYGLPISLSLVLGYILSQGDLFLIQHFMDDQAVGEYNAGYNLANRSLDILFVWIGLAVTPVAVTMLEQEGLEKTKDVLKTYGATMVLMILPAATGIALVAEPAGTIVLGESVRAEAIKIMPWIAFAGVMNGFISFYVQRAFMLSQRTAMHAMIMVIPVVLNIGLNIWLIPLYGLKGAVWATLASYGVGLLLSVILARKYFPLPLPFEALAKCGFACAVMAGIVLALPISDDMPALLELMIKGAVGAAVYGLVVFATNAADCRTLVKDLTAKLRDRQVTAEEVSA